MVEMEAVFRSLTHFDGSGRKVSGAIDDGVLSRGDDADVERRFLPIHPRRDVDIGRARLRAGDEGGHFHSGAKGGALCFLVDEVADAIVAATLHTVVVLAVEGVVSIDVHLSAAVLGAAVPSFEDFEA